MNSLEKYIKENRSLFDEEPTAGHFERLQQKMTRRPSEKRIIAIRWGLSIAASIAILFTAGSILLQKNNPTEMDICESASNMKICYLDKMNELANRIEELVMDFDQWDRQQIMDDVHYLIETVNDDFESELPEELPDNIAKAILSDYYQQNLEGLEMIEEKVKNVGITIWGF